MKAIFLLYFLTISFAHSAPSISRNERLFDIAYRHKFFYTSYYFLKMSIAESRTNLEQKKISDILNIIHPSLFIYDQQLDQFAERKTPLDFPTGLRLFFQNKSSLAAERLRSITPEDTMYIESNYLLGLIYLKKKKNKEAFRHFSICAKSAKDNKPSELKQQTYIDTFEGRCIQQMSRLQFSGKNFKQSLKVQEMVKKTDYIWPQLLLDKAWSLYWNNEKPRALGTIMSYNSPVLQKFITPEATYLKALIYFDFCQYGKVNKIYKEFIPLLQIQQKIASISAERMQNLMAGNANTVEDEAIKLFHSYLKGLKKDIRYLNYKHSSKYIADEIKKLSRFKHMKNTSGFLEELNSYQNIINEDFKDFLVSLRDDYINQIENVQRHFVKMNLYMSSQKRKDISKNTISTEKKGIFLNLDDIPHSSDQNIWDFRGGFWADELGDYAIALENRCKK